MKALKITISALLALAVLLVPFAIMLGITFILPSPYGNLFHAELDEKMDRLTSIEEEKIIVVGGSSVAFGLNSVLLEQIIGMPVVNFGLYASLGTKMMLDLSLAGVREGDIVIIAPETDAQTMSLYFGAETALEALDEDYSMLEYITDEADRLALIGSIFEHSGKKLSYVINGDPDPKGVYNSASFNEYGDISYERPENVMENYFQMGEENRIRLDEDLITEEFFDYLNEYVAECRRRGAEVYYSFCPMNGLAMDKDTDEESLAEFEEALKEALDCRLISYASDYIMDAGYFYDTNYHLNDTGVLYRTMQLADDIMLALGKPIYIEAQKPDPPELKSGLILLEGTDENEKYFTYERLPSGNYMITGLTKLGMKQNELTLPVSVKLADSEYSIAVTAIAENAFSGGVAERIVISSTSYISQIMNGAFLDSGLRRLDIHVENAECILPPVAFTGVAQSFTVHVPDGSNYTTDYYWSQVSVRIVADLD